MFKDTNELRNNSSEKNGLIKPRNIIRDSFAIGITNEVSSHKDSPENKMREMEKNAVNMIMDFIERKNSHIDSDKSQGNGRDMPLFSRQELELAQEKGIDLYKSVRDAREVVVNMMQFGGQNSDQCKLFSPVDNLEYSYTICGDGHSLMKYAYINNSRSEIYFSDNDADSRFPVGTSQNEYALVYRSNENRIVGLPLELKDLGPDALSGNDRRILTKVIRIFDRDREYDKLIMNNNIKRYPTSSTSVEYIHLLKALDTFERYKAINGILNSSGTVPNGWINSAADSLKAYNEIKVKYSTYNKFVKQRVDIFKLLDD